MGMRGKEGSLLTRLLFLLEGIKAFLIYMGALMWDFAVCTVYA